MPLPVPEGFPEVKTTTQTASGRRPEHSNHEWLFPDLNEHALVSPLHQKAFQLGHRTDEFMTTGRSASQMCDNASIGDFDAEALLFELVNENGFLSWHSDFAIGWK